MQQCSLCLQCRDLKRSHLMPKSFYKVVRRAFPESKEQGVVFSTREGSSYTDRQVVKPLLCADCEQIFSSKGEQVVCKECYRGGGNFILRDKLKATSEMFTEKGKGWIIPSTEAKGISLNHEAYLYFGASIIWRTSVGKWPESIGKRYGCLGIYEEKIRRYLIGETDFPSKVFLLIFVNNEEEDQELNFNSIVSFPSCKKLEGYHAHSFVVPGMYFFLIVGRMSGPIEKGFRVADTPILFAERSFKDKEFYEIFPEGVLKPKGRLAREIDNAEEF